MSPEGFLAPKKVGMFLVNWKGVIEPLTLVVHWPGFVAALKSKLELRVRVAVHEFSFAQTMIGRCLI